MASRDDHATMFPRFLVTEDRSQPDVILGSVSSVAHGSETWIGHGWIGYLLHGTTVICGRWHDLGELWAFTVDSVDEADAVRGQREWSILGVGWGDKAALVLDRQRAWHRARFVPTDALRFEGGGSVLLGRAIGSESEGGEIVRGGWDHEHCAICQETIGPTGQAEGYLNPPETWVCERCYVDFVSRGSLDFIENV